MNSNLHPMTDPKTWRRTVESASLDELKEAQSSFRFSHSQARQIEARIARLTKKPYTGETEANDALL